MECYYTGDTEEISMIHKKQIVCFSHWYSPIIIRTHLTYVISIFVLFFIPESSAFNNMSTNLYIISDQSFVGDRNQLLGVAREIEKYFKSKSIIVYYTSVMTSDHKKHVQQEFNDGRISVLDQDMHLQLNSYAQSPPTTSAQDIAKVIYNAWRHSAKNSL